MLRSLKSSGKRCSRGIRRHSQGMTQTASLPKRLWENNQQGIEEIWGLSWEELINVYTLGKTA